MTSIGKSLPKEVIEHWPEIFDEVKLTVVPLEYLYSVLINFKDGKTWEIKITVAVRNEGWRSFEKKLSELCKTYEANIVDVDFKLDTEKVKRDIKRSTKKFLKMRKID